MGNGSGNGTGFELKKFAGFGEMFKSTDPDKVKNVGAAGAADGGGVKELRLNTLHAYKDHPFRPYNGQRFDDMVASIRDNGVIAPVIVRPITATNFAAGDTANTVGGAAAMGGFGETAYEILSGHNRVTAARAAGLDTIPAIVREGLTDEDALLIVTETNLIQRSFADMSHSERAVTLSMHHEAIKKQGKRTDLIAEIESLLSGENASNGAENSTYAPMVQKSVARDKIAQDYGLDRGTVARYLRVNTLLDPFKERLDSGELAIRAAVTLSYLSGDEQQAVDEILSVSSYKIDMKKAEALRTAAERRKLDHSTIEEILSGAKKPKAPRPTAFKLKPKIVAQYFTPEQKPQEIEDTITRALEYYFTHIRDERTNDDGELGDEEHDGDRDDYNDGNADDRDEFDDEEQEQ